MALKVEAGRNVKTEKGADKRCLAGWVEFKGNGIPSWAKGKSFKVEHSCPYKKTERLHSYSLSDVNHESYAFVVAKIGSDFLDTFEKKMIPFIGASDSSCKEETRVFSGHYPLSDYEVVRLPKEEGIRLSTAAYRNFKRKMGFD